MSRPRYICPALTVMLAGLIAVGLAGCERAKTKLDREVDRLCAIDGGVRVYETVTLPKDNFGANGEVFPQYRHLFETRGDLGPDYVADYQLNALVAGDPALQKIRVAVLRKADGKILGEFIDYKRTGGDLPGPWEPSRKSCPTGHESGDLYRQIFVSEKS